MENKLISMVDFVLEQSKIGIEPQSLTAQMESRDAKFNKIVNYANFLKQPLELWMFVPCDLEGNVLEKPKNYELWKSGEAIAFPIGTNDLCFIWEQAKSRVVFEDFEIKDYSDARDGIKKTICWKKTLHVFWYKDNIWNPSIGIKSVEDLANYGLSIKSAACA
jgi:hypothetical protein